MTGRRPARWWRATRAAGIPMIDALAGAVTATDAGALLAMLRPDVVTLVDDGGREARSRDALRGADAAARELRIALAGRELRRVSINGDPGLVALAGERAVATVCASERGGRIAELWIVRDPAKLANWARH
ncbi:sigma-70 family RNA polymerase sigma factor family protein [Microbacterium galbinum]|uniref:Siderophore-interacting protein n=1 Tax=Microbacterium galbinum TaxID=2851646 RepID=A0ABY4IRR0_9MICO|nr:hypothetical protein [Microbacterium galbinum]UPL14742.1 hypothetical protein KV396_09730 [Microbacterium galbinum]